MSRPIETGKSRTVDVVIIGAGHAGLAASCYLQQYGVDHVLLERGEIANTWRHDRWDSLKLLTPNWMCQFPGFAYSGQDKTGFMSKSTLVDLLGNYAREINPPLELATQVVKVCPVKGGYSVLTNRGDWCCRAVVLANGACSQVSVPEISQAIPNSVQQITAAAYRNADQLPAGGVLVVGASATGLQLTSEIHRSGRPVTLSTGEHVRLPRNYRGQDIHWWMNHLGLLDDRYDQIDDIARARRIPSPQLIGDHEMSLDLNSLADQGVKLVGRLAGVSSSKLQFSGSLKNHCASADLKMQRLLAQIDFVISESMFDFAQGTSPEDKPDPTQVPAIPQLDLDLGTGEIKSILWATGFKPDYSWLDMPVFDRKGQLCHDGGVVNAPGLYALGLPFLRKRKSSYIYGISDDARNICQHVTRYLDVSANLRFFDFPGYINSNSALQNAIV